jgi:membrane-bound ClpP family serine protease
MTPEPISVTPFAIVALRDPTVAYGMLVAALCGAVLSAAGSTLIPAATSAVGFALLALLAYQNVPFSGHGFALLVLGAALMHVEFRTPTYGAAGFGGIAAAALGSWLLLAPVDGPARFAAASAGAAALLAATVRTIRQKTLPP